MTTSEFVTSLRKRGVELRPNGDRLHCSAPKGVLTPSIRTGLAERKEEILVFLKANVDTRSSSLSLQPISRDGELPLSFAQERLWFLEQLDAAAHKASNISVAVRLKGALNVTALHQAVNDTVIRHEVLRTTCSTVNGRPVQVIVPELRIDLPMIDLREIPSIQREAKALELANEEAGQSFDLARGPLLRVTLLQLGSGDHVLLLTTHLFVADGWSM